MERKLYPIGIQTFEEIRKKTISISTKPNMFTGWRTTMVSSFFWVVREGSASRCSCLLSKVTSRGKKLFEGLAIDIVFALLTNFRINVELHTAKGRTDITMETDDFVYIIELKFAGSAQKALEQIEQRNYAAAFALQNKTIIKLGINFEVKDDICGIEWKIK